MQRVNCWKTLAQQKLPNFGEQFKEFHIFVRFVKLRARELLHNLICLLLISKILIIFLNLCISQSSSYFHN